MIKEALKRIDGWVSTVTAIGQDGKDKLNSYEFDPVILAPQELEALWRGSALCARVVETIPDEMTRKGFDLVSQANKDGADGVLSQLDDLNALKKLNEGMRFGRALGGGYVFMAVDDGLPTSEPLDFTRIRSLKWLTTLTPRELQPLTRYSDINEEKYGEVETYRLQPRFTPKGNILQFTAPTIHETRLIKFEGIRTSTKFETYKANFGCGDSVLQRVWETCRDFDATWKSISLLVQDNGAAILKIKGLAELIAQNGEDDVRTRAQLVDYCRSVARTVLMDSEETFERTASPLAGVSDVMKEFKLKLASDCRMPVVILMGQPPSGLNNTGDGDIRWWYDQIASEQQTVLLPALKTLIKVAFSAKLGPTRGKEPNDWRVTFRPLWQPTDTEKADARLKTAQADNLYWTMGALNEVDIAKSRWGGGEYSMETTIETLPTLGDVLPPSAAPEPQPPGNTPPKELQTPAKPGQAA